MKPKTEELLYYLLWNCNTVLHPTYRNLSDSFESWMYRNGFQRQLDRLEQLELVEKTTSPGNERLHKLTAKGRLHALGGRDPEACWSRSWDGQWRMVLFDLPMEKNTERVKLRRFLKSRGFGYLQHSVWITPDPLNEERAWLSELKADVESLVFLEARPCAGETDAQIVQGAWDFEKINRLYSKHQKLLEACPTEKVHDEETGKAIRRWTKLERESWNLALATDPLLPERLLPGDYLGKRVWKNRVKVLSRVNECCGSFPN